VRRLQVLI